MAAAAKGRVPAATYVVSDACALPFKAERFDLIVSISTLDHLLPESLPHALGERCRVLRPAGYLILTLDSGHNPLHVLSNHLRRWLGRIYAERCYTVAELMVALAPYPVQVTEATAIYHVPFPVNLLAKKAHDMVGGRADAWIRGVIRLCRSVGALPHAILHRAVHRAPNRQEYGAARVSHSVAAVSGFLKRVPFQMAGGRDWFMPRGRQSRQPCCSPRANP